MRYPIRMVTLLTFTLIGGTGCAAANGESLYPRSTTVYNNPMLHFKIVVPSAAHIGEERETSDYETKILGREGTVYFQMGHNATSSIVVHAYSSKEKLEADFRTTSTSTMAESMALLGLKKVKQPSVRNTIALFYGDHINDAPDGNFSDEKYPYVTAEVIGPTYAYMIEFQNITSDPENAVVINTLHSFQAD